jgi:hypothetical protein
VLAKEPAPQKRESVGAPPAAAAGDTDEEFEAKTKAILGAEQAQYDDPVTVALRP